MHSIGAIILAAGMSKRMSQAKLLLPLHGQPMIQYVVDAASHPQIDRIVIVLGAYASAIKSQVRSNREITYVYNDRYEDGMGTSLACGMKAMDGHVDATFVFLADQPFISKVVVESIMKQYMSNESSDKRIIRPSYKGKQGHPILFSSALFQSFFQLQGDVGGKEIVNRYKDEMEIITFSNEVWGRDIDTPIDHQEMSTYPNEFHKYQ